MEGRSLRIGAAGCLLAGALGSCTNPCPQDPTYHGCAALSATTPDRVSRTGDGSFSLQIPDASPEAQRITVTLSSADTPTPITLEGVRQPDGTYQVATKGLETLSCGVGAVSVLLGKRATQIPTRVFTPPVLMGRLPGITTWTGTDRPLHVQFLSPSGTGSLFVGEQYRPMAALLDRRRMARFDLRGSQLVRDTFIDKKAEFSATALVTATDRSILGYYHDVGAQRQIVQAFSLLDTASSRDESVLTMDAALLAADPAGSLRLLASQTQIEGFEFDVQVPHVARASTALAGPIAFLSARHYSLDEGRSLDAVVASSDGKLTLLGGMLQQDMTMSESANTRLGAALEGRTLSGLALYDFDCDGLPDLVLALANASRETRELLWIPYQGGGKFGAALQVQLPETLTNVSSLAVGDLDDDRRADVALVTDKTVAAFLNGAF